MFSRKRNRVRVAPSGASLTEQKWKDRQNVNSIVARCLRGDNSGLVQCGFNYADTTILPSTLQELMNQQISAEVAFDSLSPEAKEHYVTPSNFIKAIDSETEAENLRRFGLLKEPVAEPSPVKVEITNPSPITPEGAV